MSISERLKNKIAVDPRTGCWMWQGAKRADGYGALAVGSRADKTARMALAHRLSYEAFASPIPDGLTIDHICRVRACINPEHLRLLSLRENILCGEGPTAANANKTHCPKGHEYTAENTQRRSNGQRVCAECNRSRAERNRAKARR